MSQTISLGEGIAILLAKLVLSVTIVVKGIFNGSVYEGKCSATAGSG